MIQQQQPVPEIAVDADIESKLTVEKLLASLDSNLAALLRLYYLETLAIGEIAEILNVPTGTVKSRLFYARKMMTKALHGEQDSPQSAGAKHE